MQKMSGIDLHFSVAELAPLQGKRIARIRKSGSGIYLFKIGASELLFEPGVRLHLTRQVIKAAEAPDGFVAYLRKNIEGKTAAKIEQHGNDRIVEITTKSKERLVFELFRKGNLILAGEDGIIAACFLREEAGGRKIARGERYEYPKATPYEAKLPQSAGFSVKEDEKGGPLSFSCDASCGGKAFGSFGDAADCYYANQRHESEGKRAHDAKMKSLKARLASQQEALARIEEEREGAKLAGDFVYGNYERIEGLLSIVMEMKKAGRKEEEINRKIAALGARLGGATLEIEA